MGWSYAKPRGWTTTTKRILQRDGRQCYRRGPQCIGAATQVDHVIPHSQGGSHDDSNLAAICKPCHDEKTKVEATAGKKRRSGRLPAERLPGLLRGVGGTRRLCGRWTCRYSASQAACGLSVIFRSAWGDAQHG